LTPQALLAQLYQGLAARTGLAPADVDEVILGCVTQHGEQAGNIARSSVLYAGWPDHVPGLTVHRYCSSSIDAIALAALKVVCGPGRIHGCRRRRDDVPGADAVGPGARIFHDPGVCPALSRADDGQRRRSDRQSRGSDAS
jgi:acetyl-CoA C-acetyltransferase